MIKDFMKLNSACLLIFVTSFFVSISAKTETKLHVEKLNACLHALEGKSEGDTNSLNPTADTEFLALQGPRGYVLTPHKLYQCSLKATSPLSQIILYSEGPTSKKTFKKFETSKGKLSSISFEDLTESQKNGATECLPANSAETQKYFVTDIRRRIQSMPGEYQNRAQLDETQAALEICSEIENTEIQKKISESRAYFAKFTNKKSAYQKQKKSDPGQK